MKTLTSINVAVILILFAFGIGLSQSDRQALTKDQSKFLNAKCEPISITGVDGDSDLRVLDRALKNKRIVLLGEFTHGAKEINLSKNRLIAYLHEKMGFNVLLLESGIGELYSIDNSRRRLSPRQMLSAGLVGPWRTDEYLSLMDYIKVRPKLKVGGFDVQPTGNDFAAELQRIAPEIGSNATEIQDLETRFTDLLSKLNNRNAVIDQPVLSSKAGLLSAYTNLAELMSKKISDLASGDVRRQSLKVLRRGVQSRMIYIEYLGQFRSDNDFRKRFTARDTAMAENILWFLTEMYPLEKVIISDHNFHTSKFNEKETVMGEILYQRLQDQMYTIAVFGGEGEYADNSRRPVPMKRPETTADVQSFALASRGEACFLPIPRKPGKGSELLFSDVKVSHSFVNLDSQNRLNPSRSFDGLLFIRTISPPSYLN